LWISFHRILKSNGLGEESLKKTKKYKHQSISLAKQMHPNFSEHSELMLRANRGLFKEKQNL